MPSRQRIRAINPQNIGNKPPVKYYKTSVNYFVTPLAFLQKFVTIRPNNHYFYDQTMDIKKIRELIELMQEKELTSLEVGIKDNYVKLSRGGNVQFVNSTPQQVASDTPAPVATPTGKLELSPMVGVFYSAPSPNDPPFVKVGMSVQKGDQLGIIEAMKIMNPLEASQDGIIEEKPSNEEIIKNNEISE